MRFDKVFLRCFALGFCLLVTFAAARAQTSAFNFQGKLNDGGNAANANYDFQFKLFDSLTGGGQVNSTISRPNLQVINGVFSTTLDFGLSAFGESGRFLEISVRPAGSPNAYVVLGARQQILAVPFAVQAYAASSALSATNAVSAAIADNATNAANSAALGGVAAGNYARLNFANTGDLTATNMTALGGVTIGGNTLQPDSSNGLVKAMISVRGAAGTLSIVRCYNGVTGQATGNCGFTLTRQSPGVYSINLGFPANTRFISVTCNNAVSAQLFNFGANYRFNGNNLEVFTFITNSPNDTTDNDFMVIVF
ncbi:MAG: hypothetical protein JSS81_03950 [Acidobacteria bacterium]|nr:hypothetical protein [Acidobacteriota bacterium]